MVRALRHAALLSLLLSPALALAKPDAKSGGGKVEFEKAMRFYQAQEYDAALPWFEKAYEFSGRRPSTIRALAQCERSLKRYDDAIKHFKEYLATQPTPSDADSVSETVRLLEEIVAERERASKPPPPSPGPKADPKNDLTLVPAISDPPPPPKSEPTLVLETTEPASSGSPAPYLLMAGGGASIVAGTVLLVLGLSAASAVENAAPGTPFNDVRGDADAAPVLSGVWIGLLGAGVVALGGGVVWLVTE